MPKKSLPQGAVAHQPSAARSRKQPHPSKRLAAQPQGELRTAANPSTSGLHPRNHHRAGYEMAKLVHAVPALAAYVRANPDGIPTIDFANAQAVMLLNRALLHVDYGVCAWEIPAGYLCPPIPGRADYVHYVADLLRERGGSPAAVRLLDIGTGANLIYPILATQLYGWQCVGVDIDVPALRHAAQLITRNGLAPQITLRQQTRPQSIFHGVIRPDDRFTVSMCNPPFHASQARAQAGTQRKWRGLHAHQSADTLNFGGHAHELLCEGGEAQFLVTMIRESRAYAQQCQWFTSLVSKASLLPLMERTLRQCGAKSVQRVDMAQGQKRSRFVAWTFQTLATPATNA